MIAPLTSCFKGTRAERKTEDNRTRRAEKVLGLICLSYTLQEIRVFTVLSGHVVAAEATANRHKP
jgi:hypothetical protein